MRETSQAPARSLLEKIALYACIAAFSVFILNVLYGRFAPTLGWSRSLHLDGVPEFLLLFSSAVLFSIAALSAENRVKQTRDQA